LDRGLIGRIAEIKSGPTRCSRRIVSMFSDVEKGGLHFRDTQEAFILELVYISLPDPMSSTG
jgi:hypothetical protein